MARSSLLNNKAISQWVFLVPIENLHISKFTLSGLNFTDSMLLQKLFFMPRLYHCILILLATAVTASAAPPSWWFQDGPDGYSVIDPGAVNDDPKTLATTGQAKFMVYRALETLTSAIGPEVPDEIKLLLTTPQPNPAGGMYPPIIDLNFPEEPTPEWLELQQKPLRIGHLKALAAPFYQKLHTEDGQWLITQLISNRTKDLNDPSNIYPWSSVASDDSNLSLATIGQLKAVFALNFNAMLGAWMDEDRDGMHDKWEEDNGLNPADPDDATQDNDSDGVLNGHEFVRRSNPQDPITEGENDATYDTDGDLMPDSWELSFGAFEYSLTKQRTIFVNQLDWQFADAGNDPDSDHLTNLVEYGRKTYPVDYDTDNDRMPDDWEITNNLDPLVDDASGHLDDDGISNVYEYVLGFNPRLSTTSGPISDASKDRDSDGMPDSWEVIYGLFVLNSTSLRYDFQPLAGLDWRVSDALGDSDGDGLVNLKEYQEDTAPNSFDTDGDYLPDGWEFFNNLNPKDVNDAVIDSDGDGIKNFHEYVLEFNPKSHTTNGLTDITRNRDGDLMPDSWEALAGAFVFDAELKRHIFQRVLNWEVTDGGSDRDEDGLSDQGEYSAGTDPNDSDTDGDFLPDGWEVTHNFIPIGVANNLGDPDGDGILNQYEYLLGLNPRNSVSGQVADNLIDLDSDGMPDWWEASYSRYETDPESGEYSLIKTLEWDYNDADEDFDGDGFTNLEEHLNLTNPTEPDGLAPSDAPGALAISSTGPGSSSSLTLPVLSVIIAAPPALTPLEDSNQNGIRDTFETQLGVPLTSDQSVNPTQRSNYNYDNMGRLTGADGKIFIFDVEGNLESIN
jgi:Bacterial TSP3 repeat